MQSWAIWTEEEFPHISPHVECKLQVLQSWAMWTEEEFPDLAPLIEYRLANQTEDEGPKLLVYVAVMWWMWYFTCGEAGLTWREIDELQSGVSGTSPGCSKKKASRKKVVQGHVLKTRDTKWFNQYVLPSIEAEQRPPCYVHSREGLWQKKKNSKWIQSACPVSDTSKHHLKSVAPVACPSQLATPLISTPPWRGGLRQKRVVVEGNHAELAVQD